MAYLDSMNRSRPDRRYVTTTEQIILMSIVAAGKDATTGKIKDAMRGFLGDDAPIHSSNVILKKLHLNGFILQEPVIGRRMPGKQQNIHNITRSGIEALKAIFAFVDQVRDHVDLDDAFVIEDEENLMDG